MKKRLDPKKTNPSASEQVDSTANQYDFFPESLPLAGFNPANRAHREAGEALLTRPLLRSEVGEIACRLNAPQLLADMGQRRLHWMCHREPRLNAAGEITRQGIYYLTPLGRSIVVKALAEYYARQNKHGG